MTRRGVAGLKGEPPFKRLAIRDDGLCIDPRAPRTAADLGVPGAQVSGNRQRDLGAPAEARVKSPAESLEELEVGTISDGVAGRVCAQAELEADGGAARRHELERRFNRFPDLEPPHLGVRGADRTGDRTQAETRGNARLALITPQACYRLAQTAPPPISWTLPPGHGPAVSFAGLYPRLAARAPGQTLRAALIVDRRPFHVTARRFRVADSDGVRRWVDRRPVRTASGRRASSHMGRGAVKHTPSA